MTGRRWERWGTAAGLLAAIWLCGCNEVNLTSAWRDRDIVIDGDPREWTGLTTYIEKGNIAIGITNDDRDLYICLHSPTSEVAGQILMRGLTVWFDPDGGRGKKLGIRCPLGGGSTAGSRGMRAPVDTTGGAPDSDYWGDRGGRPGSAGMAGPGGMPTDRGSLKDMIAEMVPNAAAEFEVLGPDGKVCGTFAAGEVPGIQIALGYVDGRIVYELKIPLAQSEDGSYGIGASRDKELGIGFVTPEIDMDAAREAMRKAGERDRPEGAPPGDGMSGGGVPGGGMPGGGMHGGRGGRGSIPEPVEVWCKARLTWTADSIPQSS
jgi:hypothetical protein